MMEGREVGAPSPTGTAAKPAGTEAAAGQSPASDTLSNLPTQGQVAQQKEEGKEAASTFATINKTAAQAADQLQTLDQVEYALQNLQTGKLAPPISTMQQWVGSLSQTLGIKTDIDFEKLGSHEALNTIVGQMALGMHKVGTGQMTDADLAHFKTLTPSLSKTPEGNAKIIEAARKLANRQIELSELAKQYRETNPKGILDAGWEKHKRAWMEANPLYPEAVKEKEATSAPASETTGAASKVRRFNPETGRIE